MDKMMSRTVPPVLLKSSYRKVVDIRPFTVRVRRSELPYRNGWAMCPKPAAKEAIERRRFNWW
jgi:hypothetical protein